MPSAVLSLSGGMDSATVLTWLLENGYDVHPIQFQYGSKHNPYELEMTRKLVDIHSSNELLHDLKEIDISRAMRDFKSDLLRSGGDIPEGHYQDATMSRTVVPGRNMIFLSMAAGYAWSIEAQYIALGIHQGDHAIYEDCRTEFFKAMDSAIYLGTGGRVEILAPFLKTDKGGIAKYGLEHGTPYNLTRTCYKDQPLACGKCGACQERILAFSSNKAHDVISYEDTKQYFSIWEGGQK